MRLFILFMLSFSYSTAFSCKLESREFNQIGFFAKIDLYEANDSKYIVLIIPPTGGMNFIDISYAKKFCNAGINAAIVKNWSQDDEYNLELEIHTRFYNRAQRAIDLVISRFVDYEFGLLGTSVGGLHASIAVARKPEISKAFVIVSGGNIVEIISNTTQEILVDAKVKRFKRYGFKTLNDYEKALSLILPFEPLELNISDKKKLGMIVSTNDSIVPTKNQLELKEFWKPEFFKTSWLGHTPTVIKTWMFNQSEIIEFFKL